ncbi:SMP-30/gluconolactonase/LRE family protein [Methylobacter sp. YRD-M1]|uniref:SMP-30/gluconolactonase/LRE family protein n=1 Tax=Methylobacter sp. YRD-M1 TaxID=2911520 RepID=UPI00227BD608|nr:SMP-30/gluconolactonase/LRE family protein [Methylobacter sp. YRD-M1]WAK03935.1 SMP-30/gluconolactonase/LRE family protein [Methylobacter sp. YRD-M1]
MDDTEVLVTGLVFPEAPRWRGDRLWFTDQHARRVMTVTPDGQAECRLEMDDLPGGLGWLPDGTPLVVAMTERAVYRIIDHGLALHADLSGLAPFHCNDMIVTAEGRAYVGNFGYDLHGGEPPAETCLIAVEPDGRCRTAAAGLVFPNGCAITPDGTTLIVAETFASRLTAFLISDDGLLHSPHLWANLGDATPDGICLDKEGALWVASPGTCSVLRVSQGGDVLSLIRPTGIPYACMLGGPDRRTLFITTAETDDPYQALIMESGRIEVAEVAVPGAGRP